MINFPISEADFCNYEFNPRKLQELRRGLHSDYEQLKKISQTLPSRWRSDFSSLRLCADRLPLTCATGILLNQAAAALRERASLATQLNSALSHLPRSYQLVELLADALLYTLDEANSALALIERIS